MLHSRTFRSTGCTERLHLFNPVQRAGQQALVQFAGHRCKASLLQEATSPQTPPQAGTDKRCHIKAFCETPPAAALRNTREVANSAEYGPSHRSHRSP